MKLTELATERIAMITLEEYTRLVEESEQCRILKRMAEKERYLDADMVNYVLGINKKESPTGLASE